MKNGNFENIIYLENDDMDSNGVLSKNICPDNNMSNAILFVYGDFCPHCSDIKPVFKNFAIKNEGKIIPLALKVDGSPQEYAVVDKLKNVYPDFKGIPMFFAYKNRKLTKSFPGYKCKSVELIEKFVSTI